ncbi:MAG: FimV/HubP family polar landmark protein [Moraxella sp.]|nr:FimV/HubP family polar landmark protein [Moraxella sp.]
MDILLIAVIFIIILAVVALFGLRHLQTKKGERPKKSLDNYLKVRKPETGTPVTSTAITEALQQLNQPEPQQPSAPPKPVAAPAPADGLSSVEAHIRNQNYDDAIDELKRRLMINPHHNEAMLKLLQVYGIAKRYGAFNQLYQKIQEIADSKTIAEADFLKTLIDDELASQSVKPAQTPPAAPVAQPNFNTIEFSLDTPSAPAAKPAVKTKEFDLAFAPNEPAAQPSDDDDFDLLLDEPITLTTPVSPAKSASSAEPSRFETVATKHDDGDQDRLQSQQGNIFDLSKPRTFADTVETTHADDSVLDDFDLLLDTPTQTTTKAPATPAKPAPITEDLVFDFEPTQKTTHTPETSKTDTIDDGLDFDDGFMLDFEPDDKPKSAQSTVVPQEQQTAKNTDDFNLAFDGLLLDDVPQTTNTVINEQTLSADFEQTQQTTSVAPTFAIKEHNKTDQSKSGADKTDETEFAFGFDDLIFADDDDKDDIAPTQKAPNTSDDLSFDLDELSLDVSTDATTTPSAPAPSRVLSVDVVPSKDDSTPQVREIPVIITQTPQPQPQPDRLDFVNQFDNPQITLNLAKHYLKLGEYDAAKRLLDEIIQTGNDNQQQYAQELIMRLG